MTNSDDGYCQFSESKVSFIDERKFGMHTAWPVDNDNCRLLIVDSEQVVSSQSIVRLFVFSTVLNFVNWRNWFGEYSNIFFIEYIYKIQRFHQCNKMIYWTKSISKSHQVHRSSHYIHIRYCLCMYRYLWHESRQYSQFVCIANANISSYSIFSSSYLHLMIRWIMNLKFEIWNWM